MQAATYTAKRHTISTCPVCGEVFKQDGIGRMRKFCSDACKMRAHRRQADHAPDHHHPRSRTSPELAAAGLIDLGNSLGFSHVDETTGAPRMRERAPWRALRPSVRKSAAVRR